MSERDAELNVTSKNASHRMVATEQEASKKVWLDDGGSSGFAGSFAPRLSKSRSASRVMRCRIPFFRRDSDGTRNPARKCGESIKHEAESLSGTPPPAILLDYACIQKNAILNPLETDRMRDRRRRFF